MTNSADMIFHRRDYFRLFIAYSVSLFGALIASGIIAWIAVAEIHLSAGQLGALTATASLAAAITALTLGPRVDVWPKRRVMVTLDLIACLAVLSLSLAAQTHTVSAVHLTVVSAIELSAATVFAAASTPLLKAVTGDRLSWALGRQESVFWTSQLLGPPTGGVLTSTLGASATLTANAVSFLVSALVVSQISTSGPRGAANARNRTWDGVRAILRLPRLKALYINAILFGSTLMASSPVLAVFVVQDLGLSAWQYGLMLGAPCLGGMLAGTVAHRIRARMGGDRVLLVTGIVRTMWLLPVVAVPAGPLALAMLVSLQLGLLFTTGLFNPAFAATRIDLSPPDQLSSVVASWGATTRLLQPLAIISLGFIADAIGPRLALGVAAAFGTLSVIPLLVSWRSERALVAEPVCRAGGPALPHAER